VGPDHSSDSPVGAALRIVFMGTPAFAVPALDALVASRHDVVAVVTQPDRPSGRGQRLHASAVKQAATRFGLAVLQPERAREPGFVDELRDLQPDLFVVVAYGQLLPSTVLDVPALGAINAHASLLPELRGAAPIQRSILRGDTRTGITIMQINERMDAGGILSGRSVDISATDDAGTLGSRLSELAAELLLTAIDDVSAGRIRVVAQDEALATYAPMLKRSESEIAWSDSAAAIDRCVRAFRPEPGAFTFHDGVRLKILDCAIGAESSTGPAGGVEMMPSGDVLVASGTGMLVLRTVQPEGGRAMPAAEYFRGKGAGRRRLLGKSPR
jgi:methionyl-tRNA formyltransferase